MPVKNPGELLNTENAAMSVPRVKAIPKEAISANFLNYAASAAENIIDAQTEKDKRMTALVSARYRELADQKRIRAEGQVMSSQGWNTLNVSKTQGETLNQDLNDLKGQFDSKYEPYLENVKLDIFNKYTRSSQAYTADQLKKTTKATYDAVIANQVNDTITDPSNADQFKDNIERIRGLVKEKSEVLWGQDPSAEVAPGVTIGSVIEKETEAAVSKTVSNSIIQLAKFGRLKSATDLFKNYDPEMNPDDRLRAQEAMKSAMSVEESNIGVATAELALKHSNTIAEAEQFISDNTTTDKQYKTALAIVRGKVSIAKQARKDQNEKTQATIYENLNQGKTLADVQDMMRTLPIEEQSDIVETLNKNNGKVIPSVTNDLKYSDAVTKVLEDPKVLENPAFLPSLIPHLNPADHAQVTSLYNSRKAMAADKQEWNRLNTSKYLSSTIKRFNNEHTVLDPSMIAKNYRLGIEYGDALIAKNPKMDQLEVNKKVQAFLWQNAAIPTKKDRSLFQRIWNARIFGGDGEDFEIDYNSPSSPDALGADGRPISYTQEQQDAFREKARETYRKNGMAVDPEAIERTLRARMINGKAL